MIQLRAANAMVDCEACEDQQFLRIVLYEKCWGVNQIRDKFQKREPEVAFLPVNSITQLGRFWQAKMRVISHALHPGVSLALMVLKKTVVLPRRCVHFRWNKGEKYYANRGCQALRMYTQASGSKKIWNVETLRLLRAEAGSMISIILPVVVFHGKELIYKLEITRNPSNYRSCRNSGFAGLFFVVFSS